MTRLGPLLAIVLVACSSSPSPVPPAGSSGVATAPTWAIFRGDLARDGHPPGATLSAARAATLRLSWQADLGSPIEGGPVVAGGLVVVGTSGGNLEAFSAVKGDRVWDVSGLGPLSGQPLIAEGKVFIGSGDGHLYALELLTGLRIWDWRAPGDRPAILGGPVLYRGLLLVGIGSQPGAALEPGRLAALDPPSGDRLWATCLRPGCEAGGGIASSVAVDSSGIGYVEVGAPDNTVAAFDVGIGKIVWTHPLPSAPGSGLSLTATPLIFSSQGTERVAAGGLEGRFTVVAAAGGSLVWSRLLFNGGPGDAVSGSAAAGGEFLFVPSAGTPSGVQAVGRDDGAAIWRYDTRRPVYSSPAVGKDVVVFGDGSFGGDSTGALIAISARDGRELWRFETGAAVVASPVIVGDAVYGADRKGRLLAFSPLA